MTSRRRIASFALANGVIIVELALLFWLSQSVPLLAVLGVLACAGACWARGRW